MNEESENWLDDNEGLDNNALQFNKHVSEKDQKHYKELNELNYDSKATSEFDNEQHYNRMHNNSQKDLIISSLKKVQDIPFIDQINKKRMSTKQRFSFMSLESPWFGKQQLKFRRQSELSQADVRSIRTMNYSPSWHSSKSGQISTSNKQVINTIKNFRNFHLQEKEHIQQRSQSQAKSSKDLVNNLKINLISVSDPIQMQKRDSRSIINRSFVNSNPSAIAQPARSSLADKSNFLLEPNQISKVF